MERPKYRVPNYVRMYDKEKLKQAKYLVYDIENYMVGLFFGVFTLLDEELEEIYDKPFIFTDAHVRDLIDAVYEEEITLVGFNNHHYDDKMLANIYFGRDSCVASHELIKVPFSNSSQYDLMCYSIDVFQDISGSLKYHQAVLGMDIKETGVGFDIDRHLTQDEFNGEVKYCMSDVSSTVTLFKFRMKGGATSITNKLNLIKDYNLPHWYTRKTDNEIVAEILDGQPISWEKAYDELFDIDTLESVVEKHLHNIPPVIIDMYRYYHNDYRKKVQTVENKKEFKKKYTEKYKQNIYDLTLQKFITNSDPIFKNKERRLFLNKSFGGEHTLNFFEIVEGLLRFADFSSYYPNIVDVFLRHLVNTKNPTIYHDLIQGRVKNKAIMRDIKSRMTEEEKAQYKQYNNQDDEDVETRIKYSDCTQNVKDLIDVNGKINGIKLILNKAFGVMGSPTNKLFNPIKLSTVTVVGQLLITELIFRVFAECETAMLVQSNTDGVLFNVKTQSDSEKFERIAKAYSEEIHISIDVDHYSKIIQSTVNNYILIDDNGDFKMKGATTKNYKGSNAIEQNSRITNNLSIKSKALVEYFVNGTSVEETVMNETDIGRFQYIASKNGKVAGFYNKTTDEWELKNNRIMVLKDSKDTIVKITKANVNKFLEQNGQRTIDESDFNQEDRFKEVYEKHSEQISELGIAQHVGVNVTNVTEKTTPDLLDKIDRDFYIKMCKEHINTFIQGNIEESED